MQNWNVLVREGAQASGDLGPQRASCPSPARLLGPNDRPCRQKRGGETERVPLKHFTFVDSASLATRRPRLAARRDPGLVEKSRDFTLCSLIKLLFLFLLHCFTFKAGTKRACYRACMHKPPPHTHTLPKTSFVAHCHLLSRLELCTEGCCHWSAVQSQPTPCSVFL